MYYPHQVLSSSFKLKKKDNHFFILKNFVDVECEDGTKFKSNEVIVVSPANMHYGDCGTPYWRF